MKNLQASEWAEQDIARISYEGQPAHMKMYLSGYEQYFNQLPVLQAEDELLAEKVQFTKSVMQHLRSGLKDNYADPQPGKGEFNRSILALETPNVGNDGELHEGTEIILARWGDGFSSPVHGHATGYMHEELINGRLVVNMYRIVDDAAGIVRPVSSTIYEGAQTLFSHFTPPTPETVGKHKAIVHSFTSIGNSETLHYLPEHTRDGRDNGFKVEHFDDVFTLTEGDVIPVTGQQAYYSRIGDVLLVRSKNVPDLGVHYIVITGAPVLKPWGLRPQDVAIAAPNNRLIENWQEDEPLVLLKLNQLAATAFREFHGIKMQGKEIIFPTV